MTQKRVKALSRAACSRGMAQELGSTPLSVRADGKKDACLAVTEQ